ncbi:hypothetical protein B0H14DRAFT_2630838 [Mycena olivaceomarginata]|nr:hypothetical protein B0H14DRAFT_2630838 [Mycena olivaceomarginata]
MSLVRRLPPHFLDLQNDDRGSESAKHCTSPYISVRLTGLLLTTLAISMHFSSSPGPMWYFAHGIYAFLILTSYSFKTIFALLQIAQTVIVAELGSFTLLNQTKRITTLQAASALVCDVLITACLCYTLNGQKSTIKSTNSILDTLKINAVNRGMLTAFAAALNIILFISIPNSFWFSLALIPSGKLYMNSMLATLNTREHIRQRIQHDSVGCNSISLGNLSSNASAGTTNPQNPANTTIDISSLNGYKSHDKEKKHTFAANMV